MRLIQSFIQSLVVISLVGCAALKPKPEEPLELKIGPSVVFAPPEAEKPGALFACFLADGTGLLTCVDFKEFLGYMQSKGVDVCHLNDDQPAPIRASAK